MYRVNKGHVPDVESFCMGGSGIISGMEVGAQSPRLLENALIFVSELRLTILGFLKGFKPP